MGKNYLGEFEELILLAILSLGPNAYGVTITDALVNVGKSVSTGALYTALSRLEEKGFIRSWMGEATAERGGRAKKYFAVEALGQQALSEAENTRRAFQTKLGMGGVSAFGSISILNNAQ